MSERKIIIYWIFTLPPKSRKWTFAAANEQISIWNTRICTSSTTSHYDLSSWMNIWSESWNSLVDWHPIKLLSSNSTFITHRRIWTSTAWKTPCVMQAQNWPHLWWFLWKIQLKEKHCAKGLVSKDEHMLISLPKFFLNLSRKNIIYYFYIISMGMVLTVPTPHKLWRCSSEVKICRD